MDALINDLKKSPTEIIKKLTQVKYKKLLTHLLKSYHMNGISLVSDALYDIILDNYVKKYGELNGELNGDIENEAEKKNISNKVALPYYLCSQKKIKNQNEIEKWVSEYNGNNYVFMTKLDGISCLIHKKDNKVYMYTKNIDGLHGQDKSHFIKYININVKNLKENDIIRGELIISKENFLKISDEFKNERNTVSGLINSKTPDIEKLKLIDFVSYAVLFPELKISAQLQYIEKLKMNVVHYELKTKISIEELTNMLLYCREKHKYDVDGIVVCDNSKMYPIIPNKKYPSNSFAFKTILSDQQAETTVLRVIYEIQKEGYLKPRIEFEPIEILGTTNTFVTGNNCKFIKDNVIGPGAVIIIIKSGDIINKIHKVLKPADNGIGQMPDCDYKWNETGVDTIATNIDEGQENDIIIKQLIYTVNTLGISFMGHGTITKFVDNGYKTFFKILKAKKEDLIEIDGFSNKIVDKIYESINERLNICELHEFMVASNCFGRGSSVRKIKSITDMHSDIVSIYKKDEKNAYELIINIHGFEKTTTEKIINGMTEYIKWQDKLLKIKPGLKFHIIKNIEKKEEKNIKENMFKDKNIVFSGFRSIECEKKLEKIGGKIITSISKNTNFLIVGNKNDTSSKIIKAKELNIKIMDKDELNKELNKELDTY
jgi:DNA ligase (NAD+)